MSEYPGKTDLYHLLSESDEQPPTHRIIVITTRDVSMGNSTVRQPVKIKNLRLHYNQQLPVPAPVFHPENPAIFSQVSSPCVMSGQFPTVSTELPAGCISRCWSELGVE